MNKETIEEAARRIFGDDEDGNYLEKRAFIKGAKWMKEQMYSEEDMREAYFTAINSTAEGWNGEHAGNGSLSIEKVFSEGYEMFIEQYKNKIK
jgi:hypothetical protein